MEKKEKYKNKIQDTCIGFEQAKNTLWENLYGFYWLTDFFSFFIKKEENTLEKISEDEYNNIFVNGRKPEDIKFSYQQAWSAKNFEIELYWKRAQYFWAFQIAAFAGYFGVLSSDDYSSKTPKNPEILFFVICIGFITALAWAFINQGSKTWQRHWEIHVDMLEKSITGPLYQIVTSQKTFSVSKINDIVSRFFVFVWVLLSIKYFDTHLTLNPLKSTDFNWLIILAIFSTLYFSGAMYFGYGRGRFGEREVTFYQRKFKSR